MIGARRDADVLRIQRFLSRNGHPFLLADPATDGPARARLADRALDPEDTPVVLYGSSGVLRRPSNVDLGTALGITEPLDPNRVVDVVVVGAGPAGLAAAVYAASEGLDTVVLEAEAPGGQAGTSSRIENYLGFPTGISGRQLAARAQVQAQKFGATIAVPHLVSGLGPAGREQALDLADGGRVQARSVVIATGARYRRLEQVADLDRFEGSGIHYAATPVESAVCDGEEVIVVGGGNSAGQAAVFLSRYAAHVHILIRGADLAATMSDYLIGRIQAAPQLITVHPRTEITALHGQRYLERVTWIERETGTQRTVPVANVFLMLGAVPNTEWLHGAVQLDDKGFICTGGLGTAGSLVRGQPTARLPLMMETSRPGIFAVGDVRAGSVKRVASGVGEGSVVVSSVHEHLRTR